jgi:hypothetical protein
VKSIGNNALLPTFEEEAIRGLKVFFAASVYVGNSR